MVSEDKVSIRIQISLWGRKLTIFRNIPDLFRNHLECFLEGSPLVQACKNDSGMVILGPILRVFRAETWLTVYRALYILKLLGNRKSGGNSQNRGFPLLEE